MIRAFVPWPFVLSGHFGCRGASRRHVKSFAGYKEMLANPSPDDWLMYAGRTMRSFSPLKQIAAKHRAASSGLQKEGTGNQESIPIVYAASSMWLPCATCWRSMGRRARRSGAKRPTEPPDQGDRDLRRHGLLLVARRLHRRP
jgi:hypothetical protein